MHFLHLCPQWVTEKSSDVWDKLYENTHCARSAHMEFG
jgi:hypothetical protein